MAVTAIILTLSLATMFVGLVMGASYKTNIEATYPYDVGIAKEIRTFFYIPAVLPAIITVILMIGTNIFFGEAILQKNLVLVYGTLTLFCSSFSIICTIWQQM